MSILISTGSKVHATMIFAKIIDKTLYRRISGIMSVPLYLDSFLPGSHLVIDNTTDLPVYQGKADVTFTVSYTYVHAQFIVEGGVPTTTVP